MGCSEPPLILTRQRPRMFRDVAIATQQAAPSLRSTGRLAAHPNGQSPLSCRGFRLQVAKLVTFGEQPLRLSALRERT